VKTANTNPTDNTAAEATAEKVYKTYPTTPKAKGTISGLWKAGRAAVYYISLVTVYLVKAVSSTGHALDENELTHEATRANPIQRGGLRGSQLSDESLQYIFANSKARYEDSKKATEK